MISDPPHTAGRARPADRPRAAHRPSAREAMLDAAEAHLGADGTLTLDSAARAAGVSKPGLMYHFATKEALLNAILDRMIFRYEAGLLASVGGVPDFAQVPLGNRHLAYLQWSCQAPLSPADLVIFADPHLRVSLTARWQQQLDSWLPIAGDLPRDRQDRLLAVRLMGDGVWFNRASGMLEVDSSRAAALRLLAEGILEGEA